MQPFSASRRFQVIYFGLTIVISAFLLFQVQPMIGKFILPWFGGGPAVWTASMLFFQVLLLGGYGYAHYLSRLHPAKQARLHLVVLAGVLVWLALMALTQETPITPDARWKPVGGVFPVGQVLGVLLASVGIPYFLLSTTSSLVQAWFSQVQRERSPYAFYALSNAASLIALISYPALFEPFWTLRQQGWFWSAGFAVYLAFIAACALLLLRAARSLPTAEPVESRVEEVIPAVDPRPAIEERPAVLELAGAGGVLLAGDPADVPAWSKPADLPAPLARLGAAWSAVKAGAGRAASILPGLVWLRIYWVMLAMTASVMLLATTNHMTQDIASVPFLWVLPLSLYLLSFVIAFEERTSRLRWLYLPLSLGALYLGFHSLDEGSRLSINTLIIINSALLFVICLLCHSELYARRPHPRELTSFYLMMSIGGALGGVLVSLIAPLVFNDFYEYHLGLVLTALIVIIIVFRIPGRSVFILRFSTTVAALILAGFILSTPLYWINNTSFMSRNFYGVVRVRDMVVDEMPGRILIHGGILHGSQVFTEPFRYKPTKYYSQSTGVGVAFANHPKRLEGQPLRVGAIGLGIGTVASYGQEGDLFRFYEIDPEVIRIANDVLYFTYLADSNAEIETVLGDARLSMERELEEGREQAYDLLIVDAFSGDSIPTHLINRESTALYLEHLAPGGIIAYHISNRHIDLAPVTARLAEAFDLYPTLIVGGGQDWQGSHASWVLLSPDPASLTGFGFTAARSDLNEDPSVRLWTDDYSNLFQVLR